MKKIFLFFLGSALAFYSLFTLAQTSLTGAQLYDYCQVTLDIYDKNSWLVQTESKFVQGAKAGKCEGYLMSVNEMHHFAKRRFCLPENCSLLIAAAAVVKYIKEHPQECYHPASLVVLNAYQTYFPCR